MATVGDMANTGTGPIHVRNVPTATWLEFKAEAMRRGMSLAEALSEAIEGWRKRPPKKKGTDNVV